MLSDNIQKYRKAKKMTQDDLAVQLHVVRQTISKWENSLSVPDADQLIMLAEFLDVSVNDLLGTERECSHNIQDLAEELERANVQIARYAEEKRLHIEAERVRGKIIWLTIFAIIIMVFMKNEMSAILLSAGVFIAVLIILYRNITLLSFGYYELHDPRDTKTIKVVTIFDCLFLIVVTVFVFLIETDNIRLSENQEELAASLIVSVVMIVSGMIARKLPYNRHTGLRLPWTLQDEGTWNIAHRILGIISIPLGLLYMTLTFFISNVEVLTLVIFGFWLGIPGLLSFIYSCRYTI